MIRVHLQDAADALLLALRRIEDIRAGRKRARVDAEKRELADVRIGHDLERERRKGAVVRRIAMILFARIRVDTLDRRDVDRCGHEVNDRIEHRLYAAVAVRRAACHRRHLAGDRRLADGLTDLIFRDFLTAEVLLHEVVILFGDGFEELVAVFVGDILHIIGNRHLIGDLSKVVLIDDRFHLDEINDAGERILRADRQLDCHRICLQALLHHLDDVKEVRARDVHLVDISHARDIVLLRLTPDRLRLRLDAASGRQDGNSAIENAQRALHLDCEVNVTGRINDVNAMILPMAGRRSRRDRDAALLFLRHPVHRGSAIMNLTDLMCNARIEEDTLCRRCLSGIDVSHDADIASFFQRKLSCHLLSLLN